MMTKSLFKLLGLSGAALVLGTASVASAAPACELEANDLRIVAFATTDIAPTSVSTSGRAFLVVENRTDAPLSLEGCELSSEHVDPDDGLPARTVRDLTATGINSEIQPGARALVQLHNSPTAALNYYNALVPLGFDIDAADVVYAPDHTDQVYAIKAGANIFLRTGAGEVITSVAYGDSGYTPDDGDAVLYNPRIAADETTAGSGFFVVRNAHVLDNDEVYYDGTFWTELPIWWNTPDPLAAVPDDVLWPAPLQVPDLAEDICGDMAVTGDEVCDTQEGCSASCEPLEHWVCNEVEDDVVCTTEPGWVCEASDPTDCHTVCGDGLIAGEEVCDDGNETDGDGCSATCTVEEDWTCEGQPSVCTEDEDEPEVPAAVCGNGTVEPGEACDDGNTTNGDGCSSQCTVEEGWACKDEPSTCMQVDGPAVCGDGIVQGDEQCDSQAGCAADCTWHTAVTGGRAGSCSTGLGEGAGGGLAMLALGLGLIANRRRKHAA